MADILEFDRIFYGKIRPDYDGNGKCIGFVGTFYEIEGPSIETKYSLKDFTHIQQVLTHLSVSKWDAFATSQGVVSFRDGSMPYTIYHVKNYARDLKGVDNE
jgi:hypothetical protein